MDFGFRALPISSVPGRRGMAKAFFWFRSNRDFGELRKRISGASPFSYWNALWPRFPASEPTLIGGQAPSPFEMPHRRSRPRYVVSGHLWYSWPLLYHGNSIRLIFFCHVFAAFRSALQCADKRLVGQPLPVQTLHGQDEAITIFNFAVVEAKRF